LHIAILVEESTGAYRVYTRNLHVLLPCQAAAGIPCTQQRAKMLRRVMVVEDEPDIQKVLRMSLQIRGVSEIFVASSGEECLDRVRQVQPDLILLDVTMPKLDGIETCRRLKQDVTTREIPVIFLSAMTQTSDRKKGLEAGAAGYLAKPFDPVALYSQILALLPKEA
jgi:two-component system, cell cycle response regulator